VAGSHALGGLLCQQVFKTPPAYVIKVCKSRASGLHQYMVVAGMSDFGRKVPSFTMKHGRCERQHMNMATVSSRALR